MSCAHVSKSSGMQMVLLHQVCRTEKDEAPVQTLGYVSYAQFCGLILPGSVYLDTQPLLEGLDRVRSSCK